MAKFDVKNFDDLYPKLLTARVLLGDSPTPENWLRVARIVGSAVALMESEASEVAA